MIDASIKEIVGKAKALYETDAAHKAVHMLEEAFSKYFDGTKCNAKWDMASTAYFLLKVIQFCNYRNSSKMTAILAYKAVEALITTVTDDVLKGGKPADANIQSVEALFILHRARAYVEFLYGVNMFPKRSIEPILDIFG